MRGRMVMLAAGHKMGQAQAQQQMQAQAQQQAAIEQAKQEGAAQAQQAAPAPKDTTAELQKLAELHNSGVLTDEEFAAMKKKLLGL
jgi:membrane protease subunit (stomatin/prohibitin family)